MKNLNFNNPLLMEVGNQQGIKHIPQNNIFNSNYLYFLGGFVEGEGSNSVSISVGRNFKYGVNLQSPRAPQCLMYLNMLTV